MPPHSVLVIGAGPAGLAAAHELSARGVPCTVLEKTNLVGGLARTELHNGYRFDIGGHRFYTKIGAIQRFWEDVLGSEFHVVPRLSRIYYRDRFFNYPLDIGNALGNLGAVEGLRVLASYARARLQPLRPEETLEAWVCNRFGRRLFEMFFQTYTEKVWGIPCAEIQADWAAQRIRDLSLRSALSNALFRTNGPVSLIDRFHYPTLGPGMLWERVRDTVEARGGTVQLGAEVVRCAHDGRRIRGVTASFGAERREFNATHVVSSMPVGELIHHLDPAPPATVRAAASQLHYRALVLVGLIIDQPRLFKDNWIYVHSPAVKVGRIQNFKNWSAAMVADPERTSLGLEYFCTVGDGVWTMPDGDLIALAIRELRQLGLIATPQDVSDGVVFRHSHAYPVYDRAYRDRLAVVRHYLEGFENLQTVGRNGLHRYNNQDHSMLTAQLAVRNLFGERHDLWAVNTERSYYEDFVVHSPADESA